MKRASLILALLALCTPLAAQWRSPAEAQRLYDEVGRQLFCTCDCRENLLSCSHNVCEAKDAERAFLRKLAADPRLDADGIRAAMVKRFGEGVLQAPRETGLYAVVGVAVALLLAAFGVAFWRLRSRDAVPAVPAPVATGDELDRRLERELKEME